MNDLTTIGKEVLNLPPRERERVALAAWESLARDPDWATKTIRDDKGIEIARQRDMEIESGAIRALDHDEFLRRSGASDEG